MHDNRVQDQQIAALIKNHDGLDGWIEACRKEAVKMQQEEREYEDARKRELADVKSRLLDADANAAIHVAEVEDVSFEGFEG